MVARWQRDRRFDVPAVRRDLAMRISFVTTLEHGIGCGNDMIQTKDQSTSLGDVLQARASESKESREGDLLVGLN
jgi:hypothetical protein